MITYMKPTSFLFSPLLAIPTTNAETADLGLSLKYFILGSPPHPWIAAIQCISLDHLKLEGLTICDFYGLLFAECMNLQSSFAT